MPRTITLLDRTAYAYIQNGRLLAANAVESSDPTMSRFIELAMSVELDFIEFASSAELRVALAKNNTVVVFDRANFRTFTKRIECPTEITSITSIDDNVYAVSVDGKVFSAQPSMVTVHGHGGEFVEVLNRERPGVAASLLHAGIPSDVTLVNVNGSRFTALNSNDSVVFGDNRFYYNTDHVEISGLIIREGVDLNTWWIRFKIEFVESWTYTIGLFVLKSILWTLLYLFLGLWFVITIVLACTIGGFLTASDVLMLHCCGEPDCSSTSGFLIIKMDGLLHSIRDAMDAVQAMRITDSNPTVREYMDISVLQNRLHGYHGRLISDSFNDGVVLTDNARTIVSVRPHGVYEIDYEHANDVSKMVINHQIGLALTQQGSIRVSRVHTSEFCGLTTKTRLEDVQFIVDDERV
jgi:hypothetical protein